jgi:4-amino-4-deoxy-L-arabinose transferase-like glycosyltransferase
MAAGLSTNVRRTGLPLWVMFPVVFAGVVLTHWTLLRLPYFWDEAGYYIPSAWDFFKTGTLIPVTTTSNAHPPLPSLLLAGWWSVFGFSVVATRVLVCGVAAAALVGVYRLAKGIAGASVAMATMVLTAAYPVWFAQSSLAHADIFAATFTLWGLSFYFVRREDPATGEPVEAAVVERVAASVLFALAALSKETAIVTPLALALLELWLGVRVWRKRAEPRRWLTVHMAWAAALVAPVLPLLGWYGYHWRKTGFVFGNPEFLRYNATANLGAYRIGLCLWHRVLHLTTHMNMFVATGCAVAAMLMPAVAGRGRLSRGVMTGLSVVILANWVEFSVLGGALLTRYLLPVFPLIVMLCVVEWRRGLRQWGGLAALAAAGFIAGIWVNPPYAFAPEDNLTYRDMIVLHQEAIALIAKQYPAATVLTAWPGTQEFERPELGYIASPMKTVAIKNFSMDEMQKAAQDPGAYDTAMIFSTKWEPASGKVHLTSGSGDDEKYFDFHHDLRPREAARLLHGDVVWQGYRKGEWAAVLRFPRSVNAQLR